MPNRKLSVMAVLAAVVFACSATAASAVPGCRVGGSCYSKCLEATSRGSYGGSMETCMNVWGPRNVASRPQEAQFKRDYGTCVDKKLAQGTDHNRASKQCSKPKWR